MKKPEKNQGFNGIRTRDLRDTGAMLYQLSYEATHWERGHIYTVKKMGNTNIFFFQSWSFGVLLYEILTIGRFRYTLFT